MPIFQRSVKTIQHADDGPGALGVGEDAEALTWNNATGHFITNPSGGGTSDHAALTHLDYVSSGHTGFAGTDEANTFTRQQTIQSSMSDVTLSAEYPDNPGFDENLDFWVDTFSAGWAWNSGAALKTPGLGGDLTQAGIGINENELYVFSAQVTGMTAGLVEISVVDNGSNAIFLSFSENGTQSAYAILVGPTVDISIYGYDTFDGRVEYVSLKRSTDGFPTNLEIRDLSNNFGGAIKASANRLIIGNPSNPSAQTIQLAAQVLDLSALPTSPGATGTAWVDEADGNSVKRA